MTIIRLRKADARAGSGGLLERKLRRRFKQAAPKRARTCRGCGKPKDQCDCPKDMREAVRRYHAIIEQIMAEGRKADREERIKRRRAKFKVV
jgi:hypothetical protein